MPDDAGANEEIMLTALAGIHTELRYTRPKIASFTPHAEVTDNLHIKSHTRLKYTRICPCWTSVLASEE